MRQVFIFIALLLSGYATYAQDDSFYVCNKWCAKKDTLLLFNSANNVIQVYCKSMKPSQYKLKSVDKTLRIGAPEIKNDTMSVMAMPYPAKGKKMRLAILNSKTLRPIKTLEFVSDSVPTPIAQLGNLRGNELPKKNVLEQNVLKIIFPNSLYSYPYRIRSYTFKVQTPKGGATEIVNGIWINNDIIKEIGNTPEGTTIEFTNIQATCPECVVRTLPDLKIKLK